MRHKVDPVEQMKVYLARCEECGDCLLWTGPVNSVGCPHIGSRSLRRVVWEMREGPLCDSMAVVNTCGRPACIEHLALATKAAVLRAAMDRPDVRARRAAAARARGRAGAAKLDLQRARSIRASGRSQASLADEHGVSQSLVSRIVNNKAWSEAASPFAGLGARRQS